MVLGVADGLNQISMSYLSSRFVSRVFKITLTGELNHSSAKMVADGLQRSWPYRPEAILVTVNSSGGQPTQVKNIADTLTLFSSRFNAPIYTFAEDSCLGYANLILTLGAKCYASPMSMIGDLGNTWRRPWLKRTAEKYQVKRDNIVSSKDQLTADPIEDLSPESEKWIRNYGYSLEHDLRLGVINNRGSNFSQKGLKKQEISAFFDEGIFDTDTLVKRGYLDDFKTVDQVLNERYASSKVREIKKSRWS